MQQLSLNQIRALPNGTEVLVELVGEKWKNHRSSFFDLVIKREDGLHFKDKEYTDLVAYDYWFDYNSEDLDILCFVHD